MKSWKYWVYAGVIIVATGGFAMYWNAEPKWQENTVENLEHERYGVRRGAVRQLAKNGDESAIAHLMERLNDRSEKIELRKAAARAIGKIGGREALQSLQAVINNPGNEATLRASAILGIAKIDNPSVQQFLISVLQSQPEPVLLKQIFHVLPQYPGEISETTLVTYLEGDHPIKIKSYAFDALGRLNPEKATPLMLSDFQETRDPVTQVYYAEELAKLNELRAIKTMAKYLEETDVEDVKKALIAALAHLRAKEAVPLFIKILSKNEDHETRLALLQALGSFDDKRIVASLDSHLVRLINDWDTYRPRDTAEDRRKQVMTDKGFRPLTKDQRFYQSNLQEKIVVLKVASKVDPAASLSLYKKIFLSWQSHKEFPLLRLELHKIAVEGLIASNRNEASRFILDQDLLNSRNFTVRVGALKVLSALRPTEALPAVSQLLSDGSSEIRVGAVVALGKFNDPTVVPTLVKLLDDESERVAIAALQSIVQFKTPEATSALKKIAESKTASTRMKAYAEKFLAEKTVQDGNPL